MKVKMAEIRYIPTNQVIVHGTREFCQRWLEHQNSDEYAIRDIFVNWTNGDLSDQFWDKH